MIFNLFFTLRVVHPSYTAIEEENRFWDNISFLTLILIPVVLSVGYLLYKRWHLKRLEQQIFPKNAVVNDNYLVTAYAWISAHLLEADGRSTTAKINYMKFHFGKHFPEASPNFLTNLDIVREKELNIDYVLKWMRNKLTLSQRNEAIYFLMGLVYVDGHLISKEKEILLHIRNELGVTPLEYNRAWATHQQKHKEQERKQKQWEKQSTSSQSKSKTVKPSLSKRQLAARVLGVSEYASMDEVKKAYRKLVKQHHPDRFATEPEKRQAQAAERFKEIQEAYEVFEKHHK